MAKYHVAATDAQGRLTAPSVLSQIDARTKATMRADLPALAEELKIGGGSGVEQVSGTVTLDASGAPIREFFTTGATTFKANGADTLISSFTAVVWRRNAQGSWGYQVVQDGWVTPAATPDTTAPVAGTLAVTTTDTKADLSVSGASDDRGYVQYSFSKDNGATWTAYQDEATYTFTGLTASTAYTFKHRVKDAAGNVTMGTAVSKTTNATPPEQVTLKTALTDTFTRADGALTGHTASNGQAWAGGTGLAVIRGGQLWPGAENSQVWVPAGGQARDVTFDVTFATTGADVRCWPWHPGAQDTSTPRLYVGANGQISLNNITVTYNASGGTTNAYTPVGYMSLPLNQAHKVRATLVGGKIGLYVNGTLVIEGTPTASVTGTNIAIACLNSARTDTSVDNLEVKVAA